MRIEISGNVSGTVAQLHRPLCAHTAVVLSAKPKTEIMKIFDVCTRRNYEKDGEKKGTWYKVGILKETDAGRKYIRLFHQPQTEFFIFDKDDGNAGGQQAEPVGAVA